MMRERDMMRERGNSLHSSGNDVKDKQRSEAHRELRESKSADRVWNFALEELGRMNINFDPAWMSEYNRVYFDPLQLRRFCIVQIVVASIYSIMIVSAHPWGDTKTEFQTTSCFLADVTGHTRNDPRADSLWTFLRLMGMAMHIVPGIATLVLLSSMRMREMVVQRLSSLAALHLMISIIGLFLQDVAVECRRVPRIVFYSDVGLPIFNNFTYSGMTEDYCTDTSYNETLLRWNRIVPVGCSPWTGSFTVYFTLFSIGSSLNISDRACACLTLAGCFVSVIFLFVRAMLLKSTVLWFLMAMLCLVSAQDSIQCYLITAQKKRDFMQLKVKKLMNVLTEKFIHTLIPPNVLDAMPLLQAFSGTPTLQQSQQSGVEFTAAWEIRMATMMFCSLDFDVSNVDDFDNLSRLLLELDKSIKASGMFKYQHVSTGSKLYVIINCPRVACPFDREQQEEEYPVSYYHDMVCLGWQLILRTNEFSRAICGSAEAKTVKMKVGINCGAVAGIVLGKCRRFYCLYGDSMNVAARMSANAKESGVCVSPQIAAHLASASASASGSASASASASGSASASASASRPRRLSSYPSVWISSDCASLAAQTASPAAHTASPTADAASPAPHTATDVPSEELKRLSMRVRVAETVCEAGFLEALTPLDPKTKTPLDLSVKTKAPIQTLKTETLKTDPSVRDTRVTSACATPGLTVVSRGLHPIKGKGHMELFDVLLVGALDALRLDDGERGRLERIQSLGSTGSSGSTAAETKSKRLRVSKEDLQALVDEETVVKKMMNYACNLSDPKMEAEFLESQVYVMRSRMTGAVCLHSLFALWQMYVVMFPDVREYFMSHGSPDLQRRMELVTILLYTQVLVAFLVSMLLILWLWRKEVWPLMRQIRSLELFASLGKGESGHAPRRRGAVNVDEDESLSTPVTTMLAGSTAEKRLDRHTMALAQSALMFLLLFFHAMSVAAAQVWPQQSLVLVVLPACMMLNFGMSHTINGLSKLQNLVLVVYANLLLLPTLYKIVKKELVFSEDHCLVLLGLSALSLAISRSFGFLKRRAFLNEYFLRKQLQTLGAILFDLVPPIYGLQLIKTEMPGYNSGQVLQMRGFHRVAALQLDICGFTTLSASVSPVELANTVNKLFSSFDEVVMDTGGFKIDTIGDAYIMVAWLNEEASEITGSGDARVQMKQGEQSQEDARKCGDLLLIAEAMLEIVNEHNRETFPPLDVRIGIGTGSVVAGMLGELSKRFSVQGEAMRVIADLEQSAQPGKVHCSAEFINIVSACARCKAGVLSRWDIQQVAQPFLSEPNPGPHLESYMLTHKMPGPVPWPVPCRRRQGTHEEVVSAAEQSSLHDLSSPFTNFGQ